jgi:hypothetical protein
MESAISWSPDGRLIALTHTVPVPELGGQHNWMTTVVDLTGTALWQCLDAAIPPASNAAWVSDRELLFTIEDMYPPLVIVDVRDGARRVVGQAPTIPCAVIEQLVLRHADRGPEQPLDWVIVATNFDGTDAQQFLTATDGGFGGDRLDLARPTIGPGHHAEEPMHNDKPPVAQ